MKKLFTAIAFLFLSVNINAQTYVSTQPQTRGVLIEHFGGIHCGYCPDGHRIANEIAAANPGKVWVSSIHAGGYAPTSYPNFNTNDGNEIHDSFEISGYPAGLINRTTDNGVSRAVWESYTNEQLAETSECNIGGKVVINRATRTASFEIEFYYTSTSEWNVNQYDVIMLQLKPFSICQRTILPHAQLPRCHHTFSWHRPLTNYSRFIHPDRIHLSDS